MGESRRIIIYVHTCKLHGVYMSERMYIQGRQTIRKKKFFARTVIRVARVRFRYRYWHGDKNKNKMAFYRAVLMSSVAKVLVPWNTEACLVGSENTDSGSYVL